MDKNKLIGILLLVSALGLMFLGPALSPPRPVPPVSVPANGSGPGSDGASTTPPLPPEMGPSAVPLEPGQPVNVAAPVTTPDGLFATVAPARDGADDIRLGNEFIEVRFTRFGAAIAAVSLKLNQYRQTKDGTDPYVMNEVHHAPILAISGLADGGVDAAYELVSRSTDQVVWRTVARGALEITRTYTLSTDPTRQDPYVIRHETTLRNLTTGPVEPLALGFNLGTVRVVDRNDDGQYLNVGAFDGEDSTFIRREAFEPGWFGRTFLGKTQIQSLVPIAQPTVWATAKNKFFATIVIPDEPAVGMNARRVQLPPAVNDPRPQIGMTGDLRVDSAVLAPAASATLGFNVYTGPKEYERLSQLGKGEDEVMQWGWFGIFSKMLLWLMTRLHGLFEGSVWAWGYAIVGTTIVVRTLMWPITAAGTRSAKRMSKIQGPLKELQEKYKDNRAKQQEETLKLFKQHKVNPIGGCLPMFVQLPIFFGLFRMLQSASELRFAEFFWATDLSAPDTVAHIPLLLFTLPLNIFPLLMGASMIVQMRMTPTPTTDNAAAKMMKFMPYMVTFFCYTFSSGLSVYWTATNLYSIFQQWVTNRRADPIDAVVPVKTGAADRAKPVKDAKISNVVRKKKR